MSSKMAKDASTSNAGWVVILILIYAIIGTTGLIPAALSIVALVLARSTTVVQFVIREYEDYHGKQGDSPFEKLKTELSKGVRSDVTAQFGLEEAGLKAQIEMINEELRGVQVHYNRAQKQIEAERVIEELRMSYVRMRKDFDTLQHQLVTLESGLKKKQETVKSPSPATDTASNAGPESTTPTPSISSNVASKAPSIEVFGDLRAECKTFTGVVPPRVLRTTSPTASSQVTPSRVRLPSQLRTLDPTGNDFRCIGRAQRPDRRCGSYSDEFLPQRGREQAAAALRAMRSQDTNDRVFELTALRDLANNMLCIHHRRGSDYDQTNIIANEWHTELYAEIRRKKEEQKIAITTPAKDFSASTQATMRTSSGSPFNSRPASPASSAGSVSTAATTPDTVDVQSQGSAFSKPFGTPTPTPRTKDSTIS